MVEAKRGEEDIVAPLNSVVASFHAACSACSLIGVEGSLACSFSPVLAGCVLYETIKVGSHFMLRICSRGESCSFSHGNA